MGFAGVKQKQTLRFGQKFGVEEGFRSVRCIFFLTSLANKFIYESHCDLYRLQIYVRENQSMKNATKKAAKKAAKKAPAKKKK